MADRSVTTRYYPFTVTTDPGVDRTDPHGTTLTVPDTRLTRVEVIIPSGHVGLTGLALFYSGTQILPWEGNDSWIIGEDDRLTFPIDVNVTDELLAVSYNDDIYMHSHYLRLKLDDLVLGRPGFQVVQPIAL